MCGIAGVLRASGCDDADLESVLEMTRVLKHRGPDAWGAHRGQRCVLGNTRLRITDLSDDGHMPMGNDDGTVWLTYNGEVTNFQQLKVKHRLAEKYRFRSTSDTEVVLRLYEDLGADFVDELTGQFAFCLVDIRVQRAWVVRDPFGIRPLFFLRDGPSLYFASEIKSFLRLPCFERTLDTQAIHDYFSLAYMPGQSTPFEQIRELDGGHLLEVDLNGGQVTDREYFQIVYAPDHAMTEQDATRTLGEMMRDSVERNLVADTPVGLTFSGGLDSSSILALVKDLGKAPEFHTFSIEMGEASFNEAKYQKVMVDYAQPIHHAIQVGPEDVLEHLVEHVVFMDEPCGDGALVPLYILAKEAKAHVPVLLTGEGGDEFFNAYETQAAYKARRLYRKWMGRHGRSAIRKMAHMLPASYRKLSFDFVAKRFTDGAELDVPHAHVYWRHAMTDSQKTRLFRDYTPERSTGDLFAETFDALDFEEELDRISLLDLKYYFIGDLTVQADRMAMAHSIEARFPWADRTLFDFIRQVPVDLRIKGFKRRYLQKQAMAPYLPPATRRRGNMGLEMPHSLWFEHAFKGLKDQWLNPEIVARCGLFDPEYVQTLWDEHQAKRADHGRALWCIIHFVLWYDLFVGRNNYSDFLDPWTSTPRISRSSGVNN